VRLRASGARVLPSRMPKAPRHQDSRGAATSRARLRPLPDRVAPGLRILLVGINPGMRSAALGHHFAGHSNRFWKLLREAGLVPEHVGYEEDATLPQYGLGLANLVDRPTPGVADLRPEEFAAGRKLLLAKVRRLRPAIVALVGVTVYRRLFDHRGPVQLGWQEELLHSSRVFVLPNPSGRNAHHSPAVMQSAFRLLKSESAVEAQTAGIAGAPRPSAPVDPRRGNRGKLL